MKPHSALRTPHSTLKGGSALLVTLLVVSLLLVLVLGLVVVVRMELRKVIQHQELLQARAHARLGAEMAVAQLQQWTGPDTRITTPGRDTTGDHPWRAHLTLAYDSAFTEPNNPDGTLRFNETFGQALAALMSIPETPGFTLGDFAPFDADGTVAPGNLLMVGPGSVLEEDDRVAAPARSIRGPGPDEPVLGAFAFWIKDEGTKAQINLVDSLRDSTDPAEQRARKATVQGTGSQRTLALFDADRADHRMALDRTFTASQLSLTGLGIPDVYRAAFHDVTLRSDGIPVNTRRGGLKRDLTPVFEETLGNTPTYEPGGPQFDQLLAYQRDRLDRMLEDVDPSTGVPETRPPGIPLRQWNSARALTLRTEQADHVFADKIFPPMSDLALRWDLGGSSWENLMSWYTLRARRNTPQGIQAARNWGTESLELHPVLARHTLSAYFTVDWPEISMHWVPVVTLWNPYNVPLVMNPANPWRIRHGFHMFTGGGRDFLVRLNVRNTNWEVPATQHFTHIQGEGGRKNELWTPNFPFRFQFDNTTLVAFTFEISGGGQPVVIPPGEAILFSMRRHREIPVAPEGHLDFPRDQPMGALEPGLAPDGYYGIFATRNYEDWVDEGSNSQGHSYVDGRDGYNRWHTLRARGQHGVQHLPFPFPLNRTTLGATEDSDFIPTNDEQVLANPNIAINTHGLDHWEILQVGAELGNHAQAGSSVTGKDIMLSGQNTDFPFQEIILPSQQVPDAIQKSRSYQETTINPIWPPIGRPALDEPFTPATPGFPAWGFSYGLRLPDHSFVFQGGSGTNNPLAAPIRWLSDFNPIAPFQIRDPASRGSNDRFDRAGFQSPPMFIGGFFMNDDRYSDLAWSTPNDLNQFMGESDESLPGYQDGDIPRAILFEVPNAVEDLVSVASLMHAPLQPTPHQRMPDPRDYPQNAIGGTDRALIPRALGRHQTHHGFMQPAHMIGNAQAHFLVAPEQAVQTFFPSVDVQTPAQSRDDGPNPPFASGTRSPHRYQLQDATGGYTWDFIPETVFPGYDSSWIYNTFLWDDFFFTPEANTRILWLPPWTSADRDFTDSADRILIRGSFNINSTSVAAWAMLLESMLGVPSEGTETLPDDGALFSRFLDPLIARFEPDAGDDGLSPTAYGGFRRLSQEEIWDPVQETGLAVEIIRQVEERGPFLSLADFVNRALLPANQDPQGHRLAGALQQAIEDTGLNEAMGNSSEPSTWLRPQDYDSTTEIRLITTPSFYGNHPDNVLGRRNQGASGNLMQADLLARMGAVLSPRSDTFTIRAAGILGNPDAPAARAWCEVTVQRDHAYIDAEANDASDFGAALSPMNQRFGRRYRIVSFRWLGEEEI